MTARTQAERTESTRSALIDAALELLDEHGWAATTSVAVCQRAGLTRGALVHHFGDLPTLLADALEAHYAGLRAMIAGSEPTSMVELVELSWRVVEHGRFKIVIEAWLAAANDPELGAAIGPVVERFAKLVGPAELTSVATDAESRSLCLAVREAILGLALGRATTGGPLDHESIVLDRLVHLARAHDSRVPTTPESEKNHDPD